MFDTAVKPLNTLLAALLVFCLGPVPYAFAAESEGPTDEIRSEQQHDAEAPETNAENEPTSHAQAATHIANEPETDGVLVFAAADTDVHTLSANNAADTVADGLKELGMQEIGRFAAADGTAVIEAAPAMGQSTNDAVTAAERLDGVESAQPNYVYHPIAPIENTASAVTNPLSDDIELLESIVANDPFARISNPKTHNNQYWLYTAKFDNAWNQAQTNGSVAIAVLDTGVMANHRDLADNVLTEYGWDAYENAPLYADGQNAFNGRHGTMVAGTAAAVADNGFGMAGASFNASIVPVKVCDDAIPPAKPKITTKSLLAAYSYVTDLTRSGKANVRIINLSLGAYGSTLNDRALENAIETAASEGIVTVCAGGNGNKASTPIYPADFDACVSVTALNADGTNVVWSDYNEYKDISAPGVDITAPLADTNGDTEGFTSTSGTSLAAPIVAGAFALMFAAEPGASVEEAKAALFASAAPVNDPENDRSQTSGSHGALNAAGAVALLTRNHSNFPDVHTDDWFFNAVHYVNERGIMTGWDDGYFRPDAALTREQAARILYNCYGNGTISKPTSLYDVKQGQWYSAAVNWAVESGMMIGFEGTGAFGVGQPLSREQLAIVMARAAKADLAAANPSAFNALPDHGETNDWACDAVIWATDKGIINGHMGTGKAMLVPQGIASRAQVAKVLMNALESGIIQQPAPKTIRAAKEAQ